MPLKGGGGGDVVRMALGEDTGCEVHKGYYIDSLSEE